MHQLGGNDAEITHSICHLASSGAAVSKANCGRHHVSGTRQCSRPKRACMHQLGTQKRSSNTCKTVKQHDTVRTTQHRCKAVRAARHITCNCDKVQGSPAAWQLGFNSQLLQCLTTSHNPQCRPPPTTNELQASVLGARHSSLLCNVWTPSCQEPHATQPHSSRSEQGTTPRAHCWQEPPASNAQQK